MKNYIERIIIVSVLSETMIQQVKENNFNIIVVRES